MRNVATMLRRGRELVEAERKEARRVTEPEPSRGFWKIVRGMLLTRGEVN